jgi:branched-chain amino acid aminotransferase
VTSGILEGVTRDTLIRLFARFHGVTVLEREIDRTELYVADEVFMCGTGAQVAPVIEIDRRRIGDGEPGPLTMRLQGIYNRVVGGDDDKYAEWLSPVYG